MMPDDPACHDRSPACHALFDVHMRGVIRPLITEEIIAEHKAKPNGPHSDALARVLNYFRRAPAAGKYTLYTDRPFAAYRILLLTGERGVTPRFVEDVTYPSGEAAAHAVFLRRIAELDA